MSAAPARTVAPHSAEGSAPRSGGERTHVPKAGTLKVIVAEDDEVSRRALSKAVALLGYECRVARDGQEAWEMHQMQHADVIVSDWRMPRMDGVELCRRTRVADDEDAYTYFILMTDYGDKEHFLRGMDAGADDYHAKPIDLDELQARLVSASRVISLYRRLEAKNSDLRRDSQRSFRVARIDPLTDVANRLRMNEDIEALWAQARRYGHRYSAALCDIDWFKQYNDHYGHLSGDEVLRKVTQAIRKELRQGDGLYRYGGEEFLVILPEQSLSEAMLAMDRVRRAVAELAIPTVAPGGVVTISVGVAELASAGVDLGKRDESPETWLRRVDSALYRAKAHGRNRVESDHTSLDS